MKVKLREGVPRWRRDSFSIVRGQVKECPLDVFNTSGNVLVVVPDVVIPVKKKKYHKAKVKEEIYIFNTVGDIDE